MITDKIETPAYVYDIEAFRMNVKDVQFLIGIQYPNFRLGYSYKTNYCPEFLREAKALGLYAEIVSPQEYDLALGNYVFQEDIIYNGVIDDFPNKVAVAYHGGIVNVENMVEFRKFVDYTNESQRTLSIGVRVNFDLENGLTSRFGIDVCGPDFDWLCNPFNHPFLDIDCVHFQFGGSGGGLRTPEMFRKRVRKCVEIAKKIGARKVDIGGNIMGRLNSDYLRQLPYKAPTMEEVCTAIGQEMKLACPKGDIMLIAECGSALVTNAMHLLTTITNVNVVRGKTFITCDCRRPDAGWSANRYDPSHGYYGRMASFVEDAIVCGCECREEDVLIRKYDGPADIGGKLILLNIGAYSYSIVNDFITPGCRRVISIMDFREMLR